MNRFTAFLKKLHLDKILAVFLAGVALLVTTACSNATETGARPNNPPVQMGGNNNPHTMGGDGYSEYKMSTDPKAFKGKQSSLPSGLLVAAVKSNASDLLYPSPTATESKSPDIGPVGEKGKQQLVKDAKGFPVTRQPVTNPAENATLERAGQAIKDASGFLQDVGDTFTDRAGAVANPGISKKGNLTVKE
ncbi:MAG TPA: DUF6658 family protein [Thermosynechococcaceae cyanobacterium]